MIAALGEEDVEHEWGDGWVGYVVGGGGFKRVEVIRPGYAFAAVGQDEDAPVIVVLEAGVVRVQD